MTFLKIFPHLQIGTQEEPFELLVKPLQHSLTVRIFGIIWKRNWKIKHNTSPEYKTNNLGYFLSEQSWGSCASTLPYQYQNKTFLRKKNDVLPLFWKQSSSGFCSESILVGLTSTRRRCGAGKAAGFELWLAACSWGINIYMENYFAFRSFLINIEFRAYEWIKDFSERFQPLRKETTKFNFLSPNFDKYNLQLFIITTHQGLLLSFI